MSKNKTLYATATKAMEVAKKNSLKRKQRTAKILYARCLERIADMVADGVVSVVVPMTEEEREERRVQGLYKDFVSYEISERFIHPENVQSFELWLSYTYPRQLAREKEKATQVDISKLKEALEGKKTVKA
jgi:sulfur relay (sulfurtransferase) DsrF/TusC family protein